MRTTTFASQIGAAFLLVASGSVYAIECNDLAPGNDSQSDQYFHLDEPAIDAPTIKLTREFAKRLAGKWWGTQLEVSCKGHYTSPYKDYNQYRISAEISQHFNGAIRLEAEKERESDRTLKIEKVFFSPEIEKYRLGREVGWRSYTVDFSDKNTLVMVDKYRVRNFPLSPLLAAATAAPGVTSATRLLHEIRKVKIENNTLKIDRQLFVNGHFVAQDGWLLERS